MMWIAVLCFVIFTPINGDVAALILARGGSKGIKLKNIQRVGGVSLLARSVHTARIAGVDDVTVSTDHPLIALEAFRSGAKVLNRSAVTASDCAPSIWGAQEFLSRRPEVNTLVLLQSTSPLLKYEHLQEGLLKIKSFDCVFSVTRTFKLRWHESDSNLFSANFDIKARPRRQDWNGDLIETGAFYISKRHLIEEGFFQNFNCSMVEVPSSESLEVDTYHDLKVADTLLSTN